MSRRRSPREPAFGSDSFLDVISNLVGIVLIVIVMVGAHVRELPVLPTADAPAKVQSRAAAVQDDLRTYQAQIDELQGRLLEILRAMELARRDTAKVQSERREVASTQANLYERLQHHAREATSQQAVLTGGRAEAESLRWRLADLEKAMKNLEMKPRERKALRYHLPVSRPVSASELIFECRDGRVTFADVRSLMELAKKAASDRAEDLRGRWELTETVGPVGAFRLRFQLERNRTTLDQPFSHLPPADDRSFRYGITKWELVPAWPIRGETAVEALAAGSRFREVTDGVDPEQVALTFFVYADSFEAFRALRDHLYGRGFVVAGRPLPPELLITGSRSGSISRGQ